MTALEIRHFVAVRNDIPEQDIIKHSYESNVHFQRIALARKQATYLICQKFPQIVACRVLGYSKTQSIRRNLKWMKDNPDQLGIVEALMSMCG